MKFKFLVVLTLLFSLLPLAIGHNAVKLGNTSIGASSSTGYHEGVFLHIGQNITVESATFYHTDFTGLAKCAIYEGTTTDIGTLVAESEEIGCLSGWNTASFNDLQLEAGDYWLITGIDGKTGNFRYDDGSARGVTADDVYSSIFPVDGSTMNEAYGYWEFTMYLNVQVEEEKTTMSIIYLVGLLAVIGVSLVLFKLKLGVVGIVWGIFGIAVAASLVGNDTVPFYPFLTLGVGLIGMLLTFYSGFEMRGAA